MIELLAIDHNGEVVKASDITCQTPLQAEKIYFALISRPDVKTVVSNKREG